MRRLSVVLPVALALLLGMAGPASAATVTAITDEKGLVETFVSVINGCDEAGPLYTFTVTSNQVWTPLACRSHHLRSKGVSIPGLTVSVAGCHVSEHSEVVYDNSSQHEGTGRPSEPTESGLGGSCRAEGRCGPVRSPAGPWVAG